LKIGALPYCVAEKKMLSCTTFGVFEESDVLLKKLGEKALGTFSSKATPNFGEEV
jgi:hypothetical protein